MKTGGFEVSHDAKVAQGAKPSGQTLSQLEQAVNCLDGAIGEPSLQECDHPAPMFLDALCQVPKGFEPTELGPFAPPAQRLLIFVSEDVLEHVAQADGATEFGVAVAQRASLLALLLATGPFVASQRPQRSLEIGSLPEPVPYELDP